MKKFENRDCIEGMKEYPDNHFDLAIVDPPYSVGASNGSFGRGGKKAKNSFYRKELEHYSNHDKTPNEKYFTELFRVSKQQIIWGANYYPQYLYHSGWIVWDKKKADGLLSQAELAFQSFDKVVRIFVHEWEGFRKGVASFEHTASRTIHPNQKPTALYVWILNNYAKKGDLILDTHVGSASSLIACEKMDFNYVGYELDKKYYGLAVQRLIDFNQQTNLFKTEQAEKR